jgi:hypothetical protein
MKAEDYETRFAPMLAQLAAVFRVEVSEPLTMGYWAGLRDLELEDIERAMERALATRKHMPRPSELRELAGAITPADRATLAWPIVAKAIRTHGTYASVDFDDTIINAAIRGMGGWERLGSLEGDDFHVWARKEFERAYTTLATVGASEEACAHLPGREDRINGAFPADDPRLQGMSVRVILCETAERKLLGGR